MQALLKNPEVVEQQAELELDVRRSLVAAAKEITELRLDAVTTGSGIQKPNLFSFLNSESRSLGLSKQHTVMRNYGFAPNGTLLKCLHAWYVESGESFEQIRTCLANEKGMHSVVYQPVYTMLNDREFVGAYVEFSSGVKSFGPKKIIITLNSIAISEDEFKAALIEILGSDVRVADELMIEASVSRSVWRWKYGNAPRRKNPMRVPPKKELYEYDQDYCYRVIVESAEEILAEMLPRFQRLSQEVAELKGLKTSSWDAYVINRSKKCLGIASE